LPPPAVANPATASDLISFLKVLPDCCISRGIRFPNWWMLLVAILAILSGQGSLAGLERFAKHHRQTLNELLGTDFRLVAIGLDVPAAVGTDRCTVL